MRLRPMMYSAVIAAVFGLAGCQPTAGDDRADLAAAEEQPAIEGELVPVQGQDAETLTGRETVTTATATIDWEAARTDFAARRQSGEAATFQIESGPTAPPVPVLLPSGIVQPAGAERPLYRGLDDGYFAKYPGVDYDITISGTNEWYSGGADGRTAPAEEMAFTKTMTGGIVSLNRYGAAYLIEFECKGVAGRLGAACIDEAEAVSVAEGLVITGTR